MRCDYRVPASSAEARSMRRDLRSTQSREVFGVDDRTARERVRLRFGYGGFLRADVVCSVRAFENCEHRSGAEPVAITSHDNCRRSTFVLILQAIYSLVDDRALRSGYLVADLAIKLLGVSRIVCGGYEETHNSAPVFLT